jgi:imidazoleglycerol phosphate synthase glutamine amidotransferase subunit HisH
MLLWKYFVRMVREENIYGMQFQLKSENTDLTILKKFGGLK